MFQEREELPSLRTKRKLLDILIGMRITGALGTVFGAAMLGAWWFLPFATTVRNLLIFAAVGAPLFYLCGRAFEVLEQRLSRNIGEEEHFSR